jgi:hypothetical protein
VFEHTVNQDPTIDRFNFVQNEAPTTSYSTVAHEENLDRSFKIIVCDSEDINIFIGFSHHLLFFYGTLNGTEAIAESRGRLEFLRRRSTLHLLGQTSNDVPSIPAKKIAQLLDMGVIDFTLNLTDTWSAAYFDMKKQTGAS